MAKSSIYNTYKDKITKKQGSNNATNAYKAIRDAVNSATSGFANWGISDSEQADITKLLKEYSVIWNVDLEDIIERWDPSNKTYRSLKGDYKQLVKDTDVAVTTPTYYTARKNPYEEEVLNSNKKLKETLTNLANESAAKPKTTDQLANIQNNVKTNPGTYYTDRVVQPLIQNAQNNRQSSSNNNNTSSTTNNTRTYNSGGGEGGGTDPNITKIINDYRDQLAARDAEIYELKHPKVYSADEVADILKADYGIEDIHTLIDKDKLTDQFNTESNAYYDSMIAAENNYRDQYLRNTGGEYERLIEDYIQSTRNNAKTRYNNSRNAMNTLQSQLYGNRALGNQDTVFNQAVNQLEQSRLAELANNPNLAKQFATNERTKLANIGLNYTDAELAAYSADRQAMANRFAANRTYDNAYINAVNTLYNSAANAAATRANAYGNSSTNSFENLRNSFYAMFPNATNQEIAQMTSNYYNSTSRNAAANNR